MVKANIRNFDYQRVAKLDADMWRSYYNHQFLKLFFQLMQLIKSQLGFNWFITLRLAYYGAWAAADYRLNKGKENYARTLKNLIKPYKIISKYSLDSFDANKAAELELEWWDIHRYPDKYKKPLEDSLAEEMAVVYGVEAKRLKEYAHYRAVAMLLPDHQGDKQAIPPDWQQIEELLVRSWESLHAAIR